jgi:hypothetical protein
MAMAGPDKAELMANFVEQQREFVVETDERTTIRAAETQHKDGAMREKGKRGRGFRRG